MLSDNEIRPDADEDDEIKDFAYYAELAEGWLYEAGQYTNQIYNPRLFDHAMQSADVYARLAAAVPAAATTPKPNMLYVHADGCPCVKKG